MEKSVAYRMAEKYHQSMTKEQQDRISVEFMYNAFCYFHGLSDQTIVQILLSLCEEDRFSLEKEFRNARKEAEAVQKAVYESGGIGVLFASPDIGDILFCQIAEEMEK